MSNHSFNETVVPLLQPDPAKPGSTRDELDRQPDAILPRRDDPETGFSTRVSWRFNRAASSSEEPH